MTSILVFVSGWAVGIISLAAWALIAGYRAHARTRARERREGLKQLTDSWLLADIRGDIGTRDRIEAAMRDRYGVSAVKRMKADDEQD